LTDTPVFAGKPPGSALRAFCRTTVTARKKFSRRSLTTSQERDRLIWEIRDILMRVDPEDMTDPELAAAIAIFRLADARLPGGNPVLQIMPKSDETGSA
jgi:hypothetical protein